MAAWKFLCAERTRRCGTSGRWLRQRLEWLGVTGRQIDLLSVRPNQDGRLEVFVRGSDKTLYHIWQMAPGNSWSGWDDWAAVSTFSGGFESDGRLEAFARGTDQALWHIWQTAPNNGWSTWICLGHPMWPNLRFVARHLFEFTQPPLAILRFSLR